MRWKISGGSRAGWGSSERSEQRAEVIFRSLEAENLQAGGLGTGPIAARIVADVEHGVSVEFAELEGVLENPRFGFVGSDFAGEDEVLKVVREAEVGEDRAEACVKI